MGRAGFVLLGAVMSALLAGGCTSSTSGQGSATSPSETPGSTPTTAAGSTASQPGPGTATTTGTVTVTAPPLTQSTPTPAPTYSTVTVASNSGITYTAHVYASDTIADCAAHAYGAAMVAFLQKHPCRSAYRVLATVPIHGRTAVLSSISTGFAGTQKDPYGNNAQFQKLENADGTGSIDDLLREGHAIPGIASAIPVHEVFQVLGQDQGTTVFDAWWAHGSTSDDDKTLMLAEQDLFLTQLTSG